MSEDTAVRYLKDRVAVHGGDSAAVIKALFDNSIDAVVTDPPYALVSITKRFGADGAKKPKAGSVYARASSGFMNKRWDTGETAFSVDFWREVLRVLKPGGHVVAFGGTRSFHRLVVAIEDAGFEIRDSLMWLYGTGFPKSHSVDKGIDKLLGGKGTFGDAKSPAHERYIETGELRGQNGHDGWQRPWMNDPVAVENAGRRYLPATDEAREWEGWGSSLKPAVEPICLARKPLSEPTIAANVLRWGTGALNIDACRVEAEERPNIGRRKDEAIDAARNCYGSGINGSKCLGTTSVGRWPANILIDDSQEVRDAFPDTGSATPERVARKGGSNFFNGLNPAHVAKHPSDEGGSAARFFYSCKADSDDRLGSRHPTVKPLDLIQWLCRLITPPTRLVCVQCGTVGNGKDRFSAPTTVRTMLGDVQAKESPRSEPKQILQQAVRERRNDAEAETLCDLQEEISADGVSASVLRETVRRQVGCDTQEKQETIPNNGEGLSVDPQAGPSTSDGSGGIRFRAPMGGGTEDGSLIGARRSCSPHEWDQGGQSGREPSIDAEGGSRQAQSSPSKQIDVSALPRADRNEQTCPRCGGVLTKIYSQILDPFAGTGTTGEAAWREGFNAVLIEREPEYLDDIARRMKYALGGLDERKHVITKAKGLVEPPGPLFASMEGK